MQRKILTLGLVAVSLVGCATAGVSKSAPGGAGTTVTPTPVATPVVATPVVATPEPDPNAVETPIADDTPEPAETTKRAAVGEVNTITAADEDYLEITVSQPTQHKSYGSGYSVTKPAKGNIFLQTLVTYKGLQDGASYNQFDWDVFVNGEALQGYTAFVYDGGPKPALSSGDLPKGRTAKGWLIYEVPAKGEVLLSYKGASFNNDAPIFEVVVRKA
jgi:hypothetical protein